ncbi:hypothetical protein BB560_003181 [Smittium megazygosporum]|uniref:Monopolin complex subunit Csm1/Pcs1 C-terminal domain-containing protein n=1 Tax=Smittium megazygosporum TaxID=133381 RepID=A0A2T9ZCN6_9FUNG|nr:hypothetical protein BB560_003181 [Smittium megazygosporum]
MGRLTMPKRKRKTAVNAASRVKAQLQGNSGSSYAKKESDSTSKVNTKAIKKSSKNTVYKSKKVTLEISTPKKTQIFNSNDKNDTNINPATLLRPIFNNDIIDELALSIKKSVKNSLLSNDEEKPADNQSADSPMTLDDILDSSPRRSHRVSAKKNGRIIPEYVSPSKKRALENQITPILSERKREHVVDIPIQRTPYLSTEFLDDSLHFSGKMRKDVDIWITKIKSSREKLSSSALINKQYPQLLSAIKESDLFNSYKPKTVSELFKKYKVPDNIEKKDNKEEDWKYKFEKLVEMRNTKPERKMERLLKQMKTHLEGNPRLSTTADEKMHKQTEYVNQLKGELDRVNKLLEEGTENKLEASIKNDQSLQKEKELEEQVLILTEKFIESQSTVASLKNQRRLSSVSIDSSLREKARLCEELSGFKVLDITNDSEGSYYYCQFKGHYGTLHFFLSVFDDDDTNYEYMPNFDDLSGEEIAKISEFLPPYMKNPFFGSL